MKLFLRMLRRVEGIIYHGLMRYVLIFLHILGEKFQEINDISIQIVEILTFTAEANRFIRSELFHRKPYSNFVLTNDS